MKSSVVYVGPQAGISTLKKIERSLTPWTFSITGETFLTLTLPVTGLVCLLDRGRQFFYNQ